MSFKFFLVLITSSLITCQPYSIYIDNSLNLPEQNGSITNPYYQFSEDAIQNITNLIQMGPVTVFFKATLDPYNLNIYQVFNGISPDTPLTFTTENSNPGTLECQSYATVSLGNQSTSISSDNLYLVFTNLNIINVDSGEESASWTITTQGDLNFSLINICQTFLVNPNGVFYLQSWASGNLMIQNFNLTYVDSSQSDFGNLPYIQASWDDAITANLTQLDLQIAMSGGFLNFLELNGSVTASDKRDIVTVSNVQITQQNAMNNFVPSEVFSFNAIQSISMTNISINLPDTGTPTIVYLNNVTNFNMSNVLLSQSLCFAGYLVQLNNGTVNRVYMNNISFIETNQWQLISSSSANIVSLLIEDFMVKNSNFTSMNLVSYSLIPNNGLLRSLTHQNWQISKCNFPQSGLLNAAPNSAPSQNLSDYQIIFINLLVSETSFSYNSMMTINAFQLVVINSTIIKTQLYYTNFIYSSQASGNVLLNNVTLRDSNIEQADFIFQDDSATLPLGNLMEYKMLVMRGCTFHNLNIKGTHSLIVNLLPFTLMFNNIFYNVNADVLEIISLAQKVIEGSYVRVPTFETKILKYIPQAIQIFDDILGPNSTYCEETCYFNYISGNTFTEINVNDMTQSSIFFNINSENHGLKNIFVNNTYFGIVNNVIFYYFQAYENATYIIGDILDNVVAVQYASSTVGSADCLLIQNLFYQVIIPDVYLYQNLTLVANYELLYTKMKVLNNIFYGCVTNQILKIDEQYARDFEISYNLFGNMTVWTNEYQQINLISVSAIESVINLTMNYNTFISIKMFNLFNQQGFYPPILNSLIQAQLYTGVNLNISNCLYRNINISTMLSHLYDFQGEAVTLQNLTFSNITLKNAQGYALNLITPFLIMNNITIEGISLATYSDYVGGQGIIFQSYVDVYNPSENTVSITNLLLKNWNSNSSYFFTGMGTFFNFTMINATILSIDQVFLIESRGCDMLFENIYFTSSQGLFLSNSKKASLPATIIVSNYTQKTSISGVIQGAFDIKWTNLTFIGYNILISNLDILTTKNFTGMINFTNLFFEGITLAGSTLEIGVGNTVVIMNNITAVNVISISLLNAKVKGNAVFNINKVQILESNILHPFSISSTKNNTIISNFSSIVVGNSQGSSFIDISNKVGVSNISITNVIFTTSGYPIISCVNSTLFIANLIQIREKELDQIYDLGLPGLTTTIINATIYNTTSTKYWFGLTRKMASIQSLLMVSCVNAISMNNSNLFLNSSVFYNNTNLNDGGGCINSQQSTITVANSFIANNSARTGGAFFENITNSSGSIEIQNSLVFNNTATFYGNSRASQAFLMTLSLTPTNRMQIISEYCNMGLELIATGYQYSEYLLTNASLAGAIYNNLTLTITDYYQQTITIGGAMPVTLMLNDPLSGSSTLFVSGANLSNSIQIQANKITFPIANSSSRITLVAQIQGMQITLVLNIQTRSCLPGEIVDSVTKYCEMCYPNYFSLSPNQPCQVCPTGAICPGGQFINVTVGFWILPGTSYVSSCLADGINRCLGGLNPYNQCTLGYSGAVCQGCNQIEGYAQSSVNRCEKCNDDIGYLWLKNIGVLFAGYLFELMFIILNYNSNNSFVERVIMKAGDSSKYYKSDDYLTSVKFFLFTNFLHIIMMIIIYVSYIETALVVILDKIQLLLVISSSSVSLSSDFSCWLSAMGVSTENLTYAQVIFITVLPIIKIALTCLFLFLISLCKRVDHRRTKISIIIISIISLDQNNLLQVLSQLTTCINGNIQGYSQMNANISCSDPKFISFVNTIVIPNMIFWGIGIPLIFIGLLYIYRNRLRERKIRFMLGGLMNNFDDRAFYWGLVILLLKQSLLIAFTLIENPRNATVVAVGLLGGYTYIAGKVKPYHSQLMNQTDKYVAFAIYVTLVMFNQAMGNTDQDAVYAYVVAIFIIYAIVIGYLGYHAIHGFYIGNIKGVNWREKLSRKSNKNQPRMSLNTSVMDPILRSSLEKSLETLRSENGIELAEVNNNEDNYASTYYT